MSFIYKNPSVGTTLSTPDVVTRLSVVGSNFSVLTAGGFMEVWSLSDLKYSTFGGSGLIENSGNTIPIYYSKSNLGFIPSKLTIEDDGITSGRRRLGMQVYVHETDKVYQYVIPNYETLFNNASGSTEKDSLTGKYTISDNSIGGSALVDAWLDSSIEGVSGVTRQNARWRIFYGTDITVTGGTYTNGTAMFTNSTGGTFNVTGFTTGTTEDTYLTGVTYNQLAKELTLSLNDGVDFKTTGFAAEVTGGTYSGGSITLYKNDTTTSLITGLEILTHIGLVNDSNVSVSGATIDFVDTTTYKGAFFDYVIDDGTNYRAGTVQSVWSSTDIQFNDSSTVDIGTTNNFSWGMELNGNNALLKANILGGTWNIRIIKHII